MKKATKAWWLGMTILNTLALGVFFLRLTRNFRFGADIIFYIPHMMLWVPLAAVIIASAILLDKHWNNSDLIVNKAVIIFFGFCGVAYIIRLIYFLDEFIAG